MSYSIGESVDNLIISSSTGYIRLNTDSVVQIGTSPAGLLAEVKAAVEGIPMRDVDMTIAYTGGTGNDLPETFTITDNSSTGKSISGEGTMSYDGNDRPTQFEYDFTDPDIPTIREIYTYTGDNITGIARTFP